MAPWFAKLPDREPTQTDVDDGRAEYLLAGTYQLGEGAKIEVVAGQVVWAGVAPR